MILNRAFGDSVCCEGGHVGMADLDRFGAELLTISLILCYRCYALLAKRNGIDKKMLYPYIIPIYTVIFILHQSVSCSFLTMQILFFF
jgi:hypothetical protein